MLGFFVAGWLAAALLLAAGTRAAELLRSWQIKSPSFIRSFFGLSSTLSEDELRQAATFFSWRKASSIFPWNALKILVFSSIPGLLFWMGVAWLFEPTFTRSAASILAFSASFLWIARHLVRIIGLAYEDQFRGLQLDPELVAKLEKSHSLFWRSD